MNTQRAQQHEGKENFNVQRGTSILCCFLLCSTMGIGYTFGNINPYITSYLRHVTGETDIGYADTLWISQAGSISANVLMPLVGYLTNCIHIKVYLIIGIIFHAASMFGTYWSIKKSFPLVVLTFGLLGGVPHAIVYPSALKVAFEWFPKRKGLICGVVLMGYGLGSLTWNQITTLFINPHNLPTNVRHGQDMYYSQREVLDNVPNCFLLLGSIFICLQLTCTLLLSVPTTAQEVINKHEDNEAQKLLSSQENSVESTFKGKSYSYRVLSDSEKAVTKSEVLRPQYHPKDVLKSRVFWTIWLMTSFISVATSFVISLFKAYGQTFINDDHFLTLVASFSGVFNAAGRPFWGMLADRIGFRLVALLAQSILSCLVVTFMTCEVTGRVAFFVWVCAMFLTMCGIFTMIPALVCAAFGSQNFIVNMGLIDTHAVISSLAVVLIAPTLKNAFGWHGLFYLGFAALFISVLLNMSLDIQWKNSIPEHMENVLYLR